jgi:hypothetical protein
VHDKYPDAFMAYRPTLPRGQFIEVADTGERDGFNGQPDDWLLYRNAYKNTLLWNVGEFFARVFAQARLNNALLIYTSDHGQDLHERGNPGLNTHCGGDPVEEEGLVPLVVIQGDQLHGLGLGAALSVNKDRSSHYNIFPTLLQLMGYDLAGIEAVYGKPLTLPTADDFTFNYRFNARLGARPEWKHIDLKIIVTPGRRRPVWRPGIERCVGSLASSLASQLPQCFRVYSVFLDNPSPVGAGLPAMGPVQTPLI